MSLTIASIPGYHDTLEEDRRLLHQYVQQRSQQAFAVLLKRHLNFVYSVCLRELGQPEPAQDAAQLVFLALAQRAPRLRGDTVLTAWLFQVARCAARDVRRKEHRRILREQKAFEEQKMSMQPAASFSEVDLWSEIEPLLNEALAALNPKERTLILLRFFEERSFREAGAALGLSEDAARMRVGRALVRMRQVFLAAGLTLSVEMLATLLPEHAVRAAPLTPAALFPELQVANPALPLALLTEPSRRTAVKGVLRAMNKTTWKTIAFAGLGLALLLGGIAWRGQHAADSSVQHPASGKDLIARVAADNKAALERMQSYYADVRLAYQESKAERTSHYWRDRTGVRITEQEQPDKVVDIEQKGDRVRIVATLPTPPPPNEGRVQITDKNQRATECDAWEWSLFTLPVGLHSTPSKTVYTLPEALTKGHVLVAEWTTENGRKQAHFKIEIPEETRAYELWIDPDHNGLVSRCIHRVYDKEGEETFRFDYRVQDWLEAAPTIFVPAKVTQASWYKGANNQNETVTLKHIQVNSGLPKIPPMPTLSAGTLVMDNVEHVVYRVDANGKRIEPATPVTDGYVTADGELKLLHKP